MYARDLAFSVASLYTSRISSRQLVQNQARKSGDTSLSNQFTLRRLPEPIKSLDPINLIFDNSVDATSIENLIKARDSDLVSMTLLYTSVPPPIRTVSANSNGDYQAMCELD
jgi:hypothetical protein